MIFFVLGNDAETGLFKFLFALTFSYTNLSCWGDSDGDLEGEYLLGELWVFLWGGEIIGDVLRECDISGEGEGG